MKSEVNAITNALTRTEKLDNASRIVYQAPISSAILGMARRWSRIKLMASTLISRMPFAKAKSGASGKAATNIITKPSCKTVKEICDFGYPICLSLFIQSQKASKKAIKLWRDQSDQYLIYRHNSFPVARTMLVQI